MLANRFKLMDERRQGKRKKEPCRTNVGWRQSDSKEDGGRGEGGRKRRGRGKVMSERKDEMDRVSSCLSHCLSLVSASLFLSTKVTCDLQPEYSSYHHHY